MLSIIEFPGGHDSARVRPTITPEARPHYDALARGELLLLRCARCDRMRLPGSLPCPWCGDDIAAWVDAKGQGSIHSWVRYHRGFLPEFEPLLPYVVLSVELDDGPRLFGRLVTPAVTPRIGQLGCRSRRAGRPCCLPHR